LHLAEEAIDETKVSAGDPGDGGDDGVAGELVGDWALRPTATAARPERSTSASIAARRPRLDLSSATSADVASGVPFELGEQPPDELCTTSRCCGMAGTRTAALVFVADLDA